MSKWFTSRNGVIVLSLLSLLFFIGRGFYDWRFEFVKQDPAGSSVLPTVIFYLVIIGLWVWGLLGAQRNSRGWLIALIVMSVLLNVLGAILTVTVFCPPGCEGWPTWQFWNGGEFVFGLLAAISAGLLLRQPASA
jgi:hypothetical protein